jgi:chromosome segregation ATPase
LQVNSFHRFFLLQELVHWRQDAGAVRQHIESLQADMQSTSSQLDLTHGQLELAQDRVAYLQARCTDSDARTAALREQMDQLRVRCSDGDCALAALTAAEQEAAVRCKAAAEELVTARGKVATLQVRIRSRICLGCCLFMYRPATCKLTYLIFPAYLQ